ncbi:1-(5-phosphoribosyl)-5-[(5-phosphoribosylamino)methylideneamino]imidazole-4-carboxamide isomerase [Parvularcula maris]|uniref:1-(5-phosphoribosyl)-5-[(5-phosphoribosylamino)methylideneamino] imidazole-4-carboxamide isomerase n=1 Tax=Parvularcula maris TaxID=2965077 RepID=A0A9X2RGL2_9PROT|nr:1-(5-phosphoribosyl)-5-[(5-phosphoribosylamino)methylideneamino]imidazole-4-carboxamide isomerase [Parvularcula maris]MCQ8184080.1 1-(5-phosphoribosyl)-5-[(5-phosphoribosylamino)methylideneamino]imidazole-4-carboxamide isomerase [Parvularcula maris]
MTSFELWPAIDLKGGKAVRLLRGDMATAKTYADDPSAQAKSFAGKGFTNLHVVDLDGAFAGEPANAEAVKRILGATDARVQLGGGIRTLQTAEEWLKLGVARVILGTAAVKDPDFARRCIKAFPDQVVIGIDAKDGMVATEGWDDASTLSAAEVAGRFEGLGAAAIVYTDIQRDGALQGPNVEATKALAEATSIPVIASGGISSVGDLQALAATKAIRGSIIGKALYEGRFTPAEAIAGVRS